MGRNVHHWDVRLVVAVVVIAIALVRPARADVLNTHEVRLENGKIVSWLPQPGAFAEIERRGWRALRDVIPTDARTGLKLYYLYPFLSDPVTLAGVDWVHHPSGLFSYLADSALRWYAYSGDRAVLDLARETLDYLLDHGMTPPDWDWGGVPYSCSQAGATEYRGGDTEGPGGPGDGTGVLEPDKVGEVAYAWLRFWELTGEMRYRGAAIASADQLARHAVAGDAAHSPWPFRVRAQDGATVEDYTAHVIGPLRLFDELIRLEVGDVAAYRRARGLAWSWLMAFPMRTNLWSKYFEDVAARAPEANVNQYAAGETARYLLEHRELDPDWEAHVRGLMDWIERTFATPMYGANAIREQTVYFYMMGSHTARYGAVEALLAEATGDAAAREKALRALSWASYMCLDNGVVVTGIEENQGGIWFSDGYGDYLRHFALALGAVPEWAPRDESHLLRASSVVRDVAAGVDLVRWETFDAGGEEVLRVAFEVGGVTVDGEVLERRDDLRADGWTWDEATGVVHVKHSRGTRVAVIAGRNGDVGCSCAMGGRRETGLGPGLGLTLVALIWHRRARRAQRVR